MLKFIIKTLGCKVNQYESEVIAQQLLSMGCRMVDPGMENDADVVVINTCTVTQKAAMQSRQATRQAIRSHPRARIIVTGCHAQIHADEFARISGVSAIVSQDRKPALAEIVAGDPQTIEKRLPTGPQGGISNQQFSPLEPAVLGARTRPFLKIQDGCDAFCTYCIVPYTRGRSRSMPLADVMEHIGRFKRAGYKEVVLTGIHLGCYGSDLTPPLSLVELLRQIHTNKAIDRLRLSSIEPQELSEDILRLISRSNTRPGEICNHLHIPLQSGDDQILQQMHRPYTRDDFKALVETIHTIDPQTAIGLDVLAGFPGETDAAFKNTYDLIASLPITYLHVFPFSPRAGTPAARFPDPVPASVIKQRCRDLRQLGLQKKTRFYRGQLGNTVEILVEEQRTSASGLLKGLTSNYVPVLIDAADNLQNSFATVTIETLRDASVFGTLATGIRKKD